MKALSPNSPSRRGIVVSHPFAGVVLEVELPVHLDGGSKGMSDSEFAAIKVEATRQAELRFVVSVLECLIQSVRRVNTTPGLSL
jgi:hypothetical protein